MQLSGTKVYDLAESIVASGFPMRTDINNFEEDVSAVWNNTYDAPDEAIRRANKHISRAERLASCEGGEAHDCFLCGILVSVNVTATKKWWEECQRYHFVDIVSGTSTMHRAGQILSAMSFDERVLNEPELAAYLKRKAAEYEEHKEDAEWLDQLRMCLPLGTLQTARITTNYRQLKTIYRQRKNHKLNEWREFCTWIESLPMADLITGEKHD